MPPDVADVSPVSLPAAVGEVVLAAEELRHGQANAATGGIWRVRGPAGSAILKVVRLPAAQPAGKPFSTSDEPSHWNYWQREVLAYESGLAGSAYAAAGISAPAVLRVDRRSDGGVELWLRDVPGAGGFDWPPGQLGRFGYELGAGQARWAGRVPDTAWLSRRWLAQYMAQSPGWVDPFDPACWDHPDLAVWPERVRDRLRLLWAERDRLLARAEAAERTLCHLDVWPANLVEDKGTSVLLDWSFTGEGAIGEDAANLIIDCFTDGLMDVALLAEVNEAVTDGYLRGLRDGGWSGSADQARTAIAACAAAKYSWFGPAMAVRAARDDLGKSSYRQDTSAAAAVRRLAPLVSLIADLATAVLPG